jgi:hypothetical protein
MQRRNKLKAAPTKVQSNSHDAVFPRRRNQGGLADRATRTGMDFAAGTLLRSA